MTIQLPGCGELKYNGFTFPATFQIKLNSTAVYNEENVTLKYYSNILSVTFIVSTEMVPDDFPSVTLGDDKGTIDDYVAAIRQTLQEPRKDLYIKYQGFGFKEIKISPGVADNANIYPHVSDVAGGPLPRTFNVEPIGGNQACRITWSLEFFTLRCLHTTETANIKDILAMQSDVKYDIDESGILQATTSGFIEFAHKIPGVNDTNKLSSATLAKIVKKTTIKDAMLALGTIGLKIIKQEYTLSKNHRKITYLTVYQEHPSKNALFPYSVKVEATHKASSSLVNKDKLKGTGFFSWTNVISARITVAPSYPQTLAYIIFLWILNQRFGRIGPGRVVDPSLAAEAYDNNGKLTKPRNILVSLEMEENIYARTHTFKAEYVGTYKLSRFFHQSGMFNRVRTIRDSAGRYPWQAGYTVDPNTVVNQEWSLWTKTVVDKDVALPGHAKYDFKGILILFDPCPTYHSPLAQGPVPYPTDAQYAYEDPLCGNIEGEESYIIYDVDFRLVEDTGSHQIRIQSTGQKEVDYLVTRGDELKANRASSPEGNKMILHGKTGTGGNQPTAIDTYSGGSKYYLVVKGYAVRYKGEVPIPAVAGIQTADGTVPVTRLDAKVMNKKISPGACSLNSAAWELTYSVPYAVRGAFKLLDGNYDEISTGGRMIEPGPTPT